MESQRNEKNCCDETAEDRESLDQETHYPEVRPGQDHEGLNGFYGHGMIEMKKRAIEFLSSNGSIHRMRVKYKPKEVTAYFVQSEHVEAGEKKKTTKSGWLLPGPGRAVFYIPEDQFSAFFEIIKDEGRIIAQGEHA